MILSRNQKRIRRAGLALRAAAQILSEAKEEAKDAGEKDGAHLALGLVRCALDEVVELVPGKPGEDLLFD